MRFEIRPLGPWDRPASAARASSGRFKATWKSTLELLDREVDKLGGSLVVLQLDVVEGDIRRDGMLAARAKVGFPGVKVSFQSKHGPLTYATDAYEPRYYGDPPGWQANIRAIALALEALRAVDRYGVSGSGEQYRGWTAIAASPAATAMTREQAAALLCGGDHTELTPAQVLATPALAHTAYRAAVKIYHPDVGGDPHLFQGLTAARDLLVAGPNG